MSYLSSDDEETHINTNDSLYPEEDMEEVEAMRLLREQMNKHTMNEIVIEDKKEKNKEKKKTNNVKKTSTIDEINMKLTKKIIESTPQKWSSNRVVTKKDNIPEKVVVNKRRFNPRLPPYNSVARENKQETFIDVEDETSFPQL
jgi:hypothetical protein